MMTAVYLTVHGQTAPIVVLVLATVVGIVCGWKALRFENQLRRLNKYRWPLVFVLFVAVGLVIRVAVVHAQQPVEPCAICSNVETYSALWWIYQCWWPWCD